MTKQFLDTIQWNGRTFALCAPKTSQLLDEHAFGIDGRAFSTACRKGYLAHFAIREGELILDRLTTKWSTQKPTSVQHISFQTNGDGTQAVVLPDEWELANLAVQVPFSGSMTIGSDLYENYGWPSGCHPDISFRWVLQLRLRLGVVVDIDDLSESTSINRGSLLHFLVRCFGI